MAQHAAGDRPPAPFQRDVHGLVMFLRTGLDRPAEGMEVIGCRHKGDITARVAAPRPLRDPWRHQDSPGAAFVQSSQRRHGRLAEECSTLFVVFLDDWRECEADLSETQRVFMTRIETRVAEWSADIWLERTDEGAFPVVFVDLKSPGENLSLLTAGVRVQDGCIHADKLHNQLFTLPDEPTSLSLTASGPSDELADRAAEWFDALVRRRVVRYEWAHQGRVYASRYLFSDTGEGLCQMYNDTLAPPGQRDRLVAAGHTNGRGWIDTQGLGQPDRIITVRDGTAHHTGSANPPR
ncbi:hypothetical protein [Sphaerisporangium perillae]|uniref:hypothetical protein n=1 Tax=Sphaerisporangium perillae TaxID=2935860 RepID=UPI00200DE7B4|nr:hypothetical protein [Sphaerisporangium perillae]